MLRPDRVTHARVCRYLLLRFNNDANEAYGFTNRHAIHRWKHNPMCAVVNLQGHRGPAETIAAASTGSFSLFSGGADGKVFKWERWQINQLIHTFESYPCDVLDPSFVHNYDIHIVDESKSDGLQKRRIVSAPPSLKRSSAQGVSASGSSAMFRERKDMPSNSMTKSLFCDKLDVLVVGGQDHNIYIWGFDETESFLAENEDSVKVRRRFTSHSVTPVAARHVGAGDEVLGGAGQCQKPPGHRAPRALHGRLPARGGQPLGLPSLQKRLLNCFTLVYTQRCRCCWAIAG